MKWSRYNILLNSVELGYCLFNSRTLSFSKLDKDSYNTLDKIRCGGCHPIDVLSNTDLNKFLKDKILVEDWEDDNYINILRYKRNLQSYQNQRLSLIICPTLACNFACPYCYEHNLPQNTMSSDTQNQLISFVNKRAGAFKGLNLNWHGGEPLAAFETLHQIWAKLESESLIPIKNSSIVSNGYLLNEKICDYFNKQGLNYMQITIDGSREIHNKTRILKNKKGTFDRIIENVDMATEMMPKCTIGVRTNIGRNNRDSYIELYHELTNRWKGKNCFVYYTYVLDNNIDTTEEHRKSIEHNTDEKNEFEVLLAQNGIINSKDLYPHHDYSMCTCMDNHAYVIDPEGYLYKCWNDVGIKVRSIGTLGENITNYQIVTQFLMESDKFSDKKCLECAYLPICSGGCNLYRIGKCKNGTPYNVCCLTDRGLEKYLEQYIRAL